MFGVLYAASINHDWLMSLFRWLRVTERTARSTIWNDVFEQIGGWVQVGLTDGVIVKGRLRYYSDDPDESSLFIEEAAWITSDGSEELIEGPGILITRQMGIEYVVFLHGRDQAGDAPSPLPGLKVPANTVEGIGEFEVGEEVADERQDHAD